MRILIADDHPLMRAALKETLSTQFPGATVDEASSVAGLTQALSTGGPVDVALLDLRMPDAEGFSALLRIRTAFPEVPVIVFSAIEDAASVDRALVLGASGYIVKSAPVDIVGHGVRMVLDGEVVRPAVRIRDTALADVEASELRKLRTLTPQQQNVLVMIAEGLSNKAVAQRLQITESTVKAHITGILLKLGLARRTQAALLAQRALQLHGTISPESAQDEA